MAVNGLDALVEPADGDRASPVTLGSGAGVPDGHGDRDSLTPRPDTDELGQRGRWAHGLGDPHLRELARILAPLPADRSADGQRLSSEPRGEPRSEDR